MSTTYTITELAKEFDITTRTIRFYEDKGLVRPERQGRNRVYYRRDRTRLKLILRGRRLGWSLDEIDTIINLYESKGGEEAQLNAALEKLDSTHRALMQQKEDIDSALNELLIVRDNCEKKLQQKRLETAQQCVSK